jgi:hypothetical protein
VPVINFTVPFSLLQLADVCCFQTLVECLFVTQWLRIARYRASTRLICHTWRRKHSRLPKCRVLKFLKNFRPWTRSKNRRLLRWVIRHRQRPVVWINNFLVFCETQNFMATYTRFVLGEYNRSQPMFHESTANSPIHLLWPSFWTVRQFKKEKSCKPQIQVAAKICTIGFFNCCLSVHVYSYTIIVPTKCTSFCY